MPRVIRKETRRRGFFGKLFKWTFIGFNILMAVWLFAYWGQVGPMIDTGGEAERAGAAIGATLGTTFVLFFWTLGAVILGILTLLTRGNVVVIEETDDAPHRSDSLHRPPPGGSTMTDRRGRTNRPRM